MGWVCVCERVYINIHYKFLSFEEDYLNDHVLINYRVWDGWPSFRAWRYL
jgi:hypothetical protein